MRIRFMIACFLWLITEQSKWATDIIFNVAIPNILYVYCTTTHWSYRHTVATRCHEEVIKVSQQEKNTFCCFVRLLLVTHSSVRSRARRKTRSSIVFVSSLGTSAPLFPLPHIIQQLPLPPWPPITLHVSVYGIVKRQQSRRRSVGAGFFACS